MESKNNCTLIIELKESVGRRLMHHKDRRTYVLATIIDLGLNCSGAKMRKKRNSEKLSYQKLHNPKKSRGIQVHILQN